MDAKGTTEVTSRLICILLKYLSLYATGPLTTCILGNDSPSAQRHDHMPTLAAIKVWPELISAWNQQQDVNCYDNASATWPLHVTKYIQD